MTDAENAYLRVLERTGDDEIREIVEGLRDEANAHIPFSTSRLQAVEKRLSKMIEELVRADVASRRNDHVPSEYDHLVDDYYRALSEDFGAEQLDSETK